MRHSVTDYGNSCEAWKRLGSPQQPTPKQYEQLETAGHLDQFGKTDNTIVKNSEVVLNFSLPRQAVSLILLEW